MPINPEWTICIKNYVMCLTQMMTEVTGKFKLSTSDGLDPFTPTLLKGRISLCFIELY